MEGNEKYRIANEAVAFYKENGGAMTTAVTKVLNRHGYGPSTARYQDNLSTITRILSEKAKSGRVRRKKPAEERAETRLSSEPKYHQGMLFPIGFFYD